MLNAYSMPKSNNTPKEKPDFMLRNFGIWQGRTAMKIGTDAILLGSWVSSIKLEDNATILDVGTGTGILALMMAQSYPDARILAVDIDTGAIADTEHNISHSPYNDQVQANKLDFAHDSLPLGWVHFDLIISNPPYFASTGIISSNNSRGMARHEGQGGLTLDRLLERSAHLLTSKGRLCLIAPIDRLPDLRISATIHGLRIARICEVFSTPDTSIRYLLELIPLHLSDPHLRTEHTTLYLRQADGTLSKAYLELIDSFLPH